MSTYVVFLVAPDGDDENPRPRGEALCDTERLSRARYRWGGQICWEIRKDREAFDTPMALIGFRGAEDCRVVNCTFTATDGAADARLGIAAEPTAGIGATDEYSREDSQ